MRTLIVILLATACVLLSPAAEIAVPNTNYLQTASGNGAGGEPFLVLTYPDFPVENARYQQLYAASQFTNFPAEGGLITGFRLRAGDESPWFDITLPNIQINFSTTDKVPDSLSPVFAANTGTGETVVFGPGPLSIQSSGAMGMGNLAGLWDTVIPLTTPFAYRPSDGNLLMDVRTFAGAPGPSPPPIPWPPYLDGVFTAGDSVSAVWAFTGNGTGSVDSSSGVVNTFGYVTLFEFTPIPEPNGALLFCIGAMFFLALGRHRNERN